MKSYDYSQSGYYFITICTQDKQHILCKIAEGKAILSDYGKVVEKHINKLNNLYDDISIDCYVIMPNHIHFILTIQTGYLSTDEQRNNRTKMVLSKIIQQFKSSVTKECKNINYKTPMKWQRSYFDHVIRNDESYLEISEYIQNNILKWDLDEYY
jgi:REP element-mobilizing transposase RayT